MANNETKVEIMAISLLTSEKFERGYEPLFRKKKRLAKMQFTAASLWGE